MHTGNKQANKQANKQQNKQQQNKTENPTPPIHIKTIFKKNTCTIISLEAHLEPEWWMDYTFLLRLWLNSILATTFTAMFRPTSLTRDGNNRETMFECRHTFIHHGLLAKHQSLRHLSLTSKVNERKKMASL